MATIREVAKLAGVAVCTVSRVLNESGNVLPETRDKVLRAMQALDYVPDELTRGVFRKKVGIVAMLVPSIHHIFFGSLAHYIERELYTRGYKLMLCSTDDRIEREADYMRAFRSNLVDGVIMCVTNLEDALYERFQKPMVMLDYKVNDRIPVVVCDNEQGASLAAEVFIRNKRKMVLQLKSESGKNVLSHLRHSRLDRDLTEAGVGVRTVSIKWSEFDYYGFQKLSHTVLEAYPEIDAVMAADLPACAFLKAALQLGKHVPGEFNVVAFDGTYLSHVNTMDITAIVQPLEQMAVKTVETITALIAGGPVEPVFCQFPVRLVHGETG
ncbi:MAG: LacI family DNA-binding transcriptional regulator [Clostridiales bacterium]|jgi:LacI family sucrose operon transcriptional repressor|nr:LacI family DNA-binding transcriptional regulator [Clostridiales bacterium]